MAKKFRAPTKKKENISTRKVKRIASETQSNSVKLVKIV